MHERRLRQAERRMEREVAELRELRTVPNLERDDPRRCAYEERFSILAAKGVRRAQFRKREFTEMLAKQQSKLDHRR